MVRDKKRTGKYRGKRSQGKGNVKNRGRRSSKGGRGQAGYKKHRKSWIVKYDKDHYGAHGFNRKKKEIPVMNLYELERMVIKGEIKKDGEKYPYSFKGKVLGCGNLNYPVFLKALSWSKKAEEKIKKVAGEISSIK